MLVPRSLFFNMLFFCLWIPLPRERKGLHCVREPHLSETFSSSAKTGGVPPNVGTPSGGRGFLLRSWWWGSGMLGTPFQNRIRILRREAGGGFTRHDLGFYSSVECRGVFKARGPPDIFKGLRFMALASWLMAQGSRFMVTSWS